MGNSDQFKLKCGAGIEGKNFLTRCLVPKSLAKKTFNKTFKEIDFSKIAPYCKAK